MWDAIVCAIVNSLVLTLTLCVKAGMNGVRGLITLIQAFRNGPKR
jgi:hypothetical protein